MEYNTNMINKTVYRYLLVAYALISSLFIGALTGFIILYPFLQILFDTLGIRYGYDASQTFDFSIYSMVIISTSICLYINRKRYVKHVQKRNLV